WRERNKTRPAQQVLSALATAACQQGVRGTRGRKGRLAVCCPCGGLQARRIDWVAYDLSAFECEAVGDRRAFGFIAHDQDCRTAAVESGVERVFLRVRKAQRFVGHRAGRRTGDGATDRRWNEAQSA